MKFFITTGTFDENKVKYLQKEFNIEFKGESGNFSIISERKPEASSKSNLSAFIDGYFRDFEKPVEDFFGQRDSFFDYVPNDWPIKNSLTGSFSASIINPNSNQIIICNDLIGVYPLYYLRQKELLMVSNSLIWLGALSDCEIDEVGVFQRSYGPEYSNIGSRTILENSKRLLPGEWIKFDCSGGIIEKRYDNSLFQNLSSSRIEKVDVQKYWRGIEKELEYCLKNYVNVNIALSGGIDSRVLLGGIPTDKNLKCHTFGDPANYENKIAHRLSKVLEVEIENYFNPNLNFPTYSTLRKYTLQTEAVYLCSWLEILELQDSSKEEVLLLGDMTESLQGRNISFRKGKGENRNSWKFYLSGKEFPFEEITGLGRDKWRKGVKAGYLRWAKDVNVKKLDLKISENYLRKEMEKDLDELFQRIEEHNLPFLELYGEIFSWYTHARNPMGKQILITNSKFKGVCPSMSTYLMRLTSNLHPNIRMNGRFVKKLFNSIECLKKIGNLPTSQIPLIPFNASNIFRIPMWYIRSSVDDYLIKRLVKSKNPKMRYRLFKSNNWVSVYQNPDLEKNLNKYFENDHLGKQYVESIKNQAKNRRDLKQWPFANMNIINAAALNTELDLIASYRKGDEV